VEKNSRHAVYVRRIEKNETDNINLRTNARNVPEGRYAVRLRLTRRFLNNTRSSAINPFDTVRAPGAHVNASDVVAAIVPVHVARRPTVIFDFRNLRGPPTDGEIRARVVPFSSTADPSRTRRNAQLGELMSALNSDARAEGGGAARIAYRPFLVTRGFRAVT